MTSVFNCNYEVIAVVVTYNPERLALARLIDAIVPQVGKLLIIDNGSRLGAIDWIKTRLDADSIEIYLLGENLGIAKAHNIGLTIAKEQGADYALLFDHDSCPAPDMVGHLLQAMYLMQSQGVNVAAVGPKYDDKRFKGRVYPFIEAKGMKLVHKNSSGVENIIPVTWLIASGSLIPIKALDDVGLMLEELFIDYVDIEWGLRAHQKGYQIFGVCNALMEHNLGENPKTIFGRVFCFHNPIRHYYQFRNPIYLYINSDLSLAWKFGDILRIIKRFIFYSIYVKPQSEHIKMMLKGVWDGIFGRMGKIVIK